MSWQDFSNFFLVMGTARAWQLLGARRVGLGGWLSVLRDTEESADGVPAADPRLENGTRNDQRPTSVGALAVGEKRERA